MRSTDREHIREIESVLQGGVCDRDPAVIESWRRCIDMHHLDPAARTGVCVVSDTRLKEHRQEAEELIHIARGGLSTLFRHVVGQQYVVLLADPGGVTVDYFGDPRFERDLQKAGLYMGSRWREEQSGTSAVGACIQSGQAVTIHQSDHFDLTHTPLSCTAAPIFDTSGSLAAVLDISLLRSPRPKSSQRMAMQLVSASARRVELANLMARSSAHWVLRFSLSPELLDIDPEAAVTLDDSGRLIGFTHAAACALAAAAGLDWREPEQLLGQSITRFFNLELDALPRYLRGRPAEERILQLVDGSLVFAHAIAPQPVVPRPVSRPQTRKDPMAQLHGGDQTLQSLVDTAYRLVQSTVPVLLLGEAGSDRRRLARALHESRTPRQPFRQLDCIGLSASMLESGEWLSGDGSTDAGMLASELDGGTLFIEELSDLAPAAQDALLRFLNLLEQGDGSRQRLRTLPRILCSSRVSLTEQVAAGDFRVDLYHRLAGATLALPPLRMRQDFDWLLDRELCNHCQTDPPAYRFSNAARDHLKRHDWPGNLRELGNVIDVAIAMSADGRIDVEQLPPLSVVGQTNTLQEQRSPQNLAQMLEASGWNISRVARQLGVDRSTVHRRMQRAGLQRPD